MEATRHLTGIIDISMNDCMTPLLEGAEERITQFFWETVDMIQQEVLLDSETIILKDRPEVKAILERILEDYRLAGDIQYVAILGHNFRQAYMNLEAEVTRILRENTIDKSIKSD